MKIFLSSTYEDLIDYRLKAAQAIERLGQQGVRMEVFGARPGDATVICHNEIDSSDAFVGIYAHRYGFIPANTQTSITEQEFDFAQQKNKPMFCFFVDVNVLAARIDGKLVGSLLAVVCDMLFGQCKSFMVVEDVVVVVVDANHRREGVGCAFKKSL